MKKMYLKIRDLYKWMVTIIPLFLPERKWTVIIFIAIIFITESCQQSIKSKSIQEVEKSFIVDDFSDKYFGEVFLVENETNSEYVKGSGWIAIFDKETNMQLIKVENNQIFSLLHDEKVKSNIAELPYGEQSLIMYGDFNFDNQADFAIMDGQNSCYGVPSFVIYLATDNGYKYSEDFTRLAQNYCGMFVVDNVKKQISTMTKSGCCYHQYSTFVVENNSPVVVRIIEEELSINGDMWDYIEQNRIDGKMVTKKYSIFVQNE